MLVCTSPVCYLPGVGDITVFLFRIFRAILEVLIFDLTFRINLSSSTKSTIRTTFLSSFLKVLYILTYFFPVCFAVFLVWPSLQQMRNFSLNSYFLHRSLAYSGLPLKAVQLLLTGAQSWRGAYTGRLHILFKAVTEGMSYFPQALLAQLYLFLSRLKYEWSYKLQTQAIFAAFSLFISRGGTPTPGPRPGSPTPPWFWSFPSHKAVLLQYKPFHVSALRAQHTDGFSPLFHSVFFLPFQTMGIFLLCWVWVSLYN